MAIKVLGSGLSPFARKVFVFLEEKGLPYEQEDVIPFPKTPELLEKSPLGKIPILQVDGGYLPDSSVICAYLERANPKPALYPTDPLDFGRVLWFEEYADTKLCETATTPFFQRFIRPNVFKEETDEARIRQAIDEELPVLADYLEGQLGENEFLVGGRITLADIAVCSPFVNMRIGREDIDAARWPKFRAYVDRILDRPSFKTATAGLPPMA